MEHHNPLIVRIVANCKSTQSLPIRGDLRWAALDRYRLKSDDFGLHHWLDEAGVTQNAVTSRTILSALDHFTPASLAGTRDIRHIFSITLRRKINFNFIVILRKTYEVKVVERR